MLNTITTIDNQLIEDIKTEAQALFSSAKGSHDWDHTERVYNLCMHIGKIENADLHVLSLAAILHDIGRETETASQGKSCHAEIGAQMATEILTRHNLPQDVINEVAHCIGAHRYKNNIAPETLEAKILFDSDKLDGIGAVGIGRDFLFAGEIGSKLHNSKDIDISTTEEYTKEDTAYREFYHKLRFIKDKIFTEEGKRIAEERHQYMVDFFDRLQKEVDGEI